jgi:probable HAF family extracellular repeat protein
MMGRALVGALVLAWMATAGWSQQPSLRWLGTLGGDWSEASGVSADGSVVVGYAYNAAGQGRAFRWTASGGMQDLGTLGGYGSEASGVSADGSVVVGGAHNAARRYRAFRWTAAGGMEDLNTTYASLLTNGSVLFAANAISPPMGAILWGLAGTPPQIATTKPSCWIRASHCTGMWTATAAWTTPTCSPCCLRLATWAGLPQRRPQLGRHSRRRRFAAGAVQLREWVLIPPTPFAFSPLLKGGEGRGEGGFLPCTN